MGNSSQQRISDSSTASTATAKPLIRRVYSISNMARNQRKGQSGQTGQFLREAEQSLGMFMLIWPLHYMRCLVQWVVRQGVSAEEPLNVLLGGQRQSSTAEITKIFWLKCLVCSVSMCNKTELRRFIPIMFLLGVCCGFWPRGIKMYSDADRLCGCDIFILHSKM